MSSNNMQNEESPENEDKYSLNENNLSLNVSYEDSSINQQKDSKINYEHLHKIFNSQEEEINNFNNKKEDSAINNNVKEDMVMVNSFNSLNEDLSFEGYMNSNFEANMEEIVENLNYFLFTEKKKIKLERECLNKNIQSFIELNSSELIKFEQEKEKWKINNKIASDMLLGKPDDIIDIEIKGKILFTTTRQTLTKFPNSLLSKLLIPKSKSQFLKNNNQKIQINRDPKIFNNILYYLRNSKIPVFTSLKDKKLFLSELEYWKIPLSNVLDLQKCQFIFDNEWCANTLNLEPNNKIVKKKHLQHGIIFCKPPIDKINNYIEFRVIMKVPCKGKSHLFLGLVDKTKYKYENLLSTFWKDSPSSYYWDTWNTKLIKINENGLQVGSMNGYGCQCENLETFFSLKYDAENKTISYYKNGVNLGVAFRNVQPGLTPSLDIWFEEGSVEIMNKTSFEEKTFL